MIENNIHDLEEGMTSDENKFKWAVLNYMEQQGFVTFAQYLSYFTFNFLTSTQAGEPFVACMVPGKNIIMVNPNVNADAISVLLRHEAGHEIFQHHQHFLAKLDELGIKTPTQYLHELANTAGDYHISNLLYDDNDKVSMKNIHLENDELFQGMVTELDFPEHPEYAKMDFDELWDAFIKDYDLEELTKETLENQQSEGDDNSSEEEYSQEFIDGWNELIDQFNSGAITLDDINDWVSKNK